MRPCVENAQLNKKKDELILVLLLLIVSPTSPLTLACRFFTSQANIHTVLWLGCVSFPFFFVLWILNIGCSFNSICNISYSHSHIIYSPIVFESFQASPNKGSMRSLDHRKNSIPRCRHYFVFLLRRALVAKQYLLNHLSELYLVLIKTYLQYRSPLFFISFKFLERLYLLHRFFKQKIVYIF